MSNDDPFDNIEDDPFADNGVNSLIPPPPKRSSEGASDTDDALTDAEKKLALATWNGGTTKLKDIIEKVAGVGVDGRSRKGVAIKKYLASLSLNPLGAQVYVKKADGFTLTASQKDYIRQHAIQNKPLEIARELFQKPTMSNLAIEARSVLAFYSSLDPALRFVKDSDNDSSKYNPPKTHEQALARINRYVYEGFDKEKLTQKQQTCLTAIIKYTHVHQYLYTIRQFSTSEEQELFESSFIRFCYDKSDLTEEEINLYINWCVDIINCARIQKELDMLISTRDDIVAETQKMPMAIVESIGACRDDLDKNLKRQKSTADSLQGKRVERISKKNKESASLVQLVDMWKNEEKRKQFIAVAEVRKKRLGEEIDRLSSMEDIRFQLWGVSKEELLNT